MAKKKNKQTEFNRYLAGLSEEERGRVDAFFRTVDRHLRIGREWKRQLTRDFENALLWYSQNGVALPEALECLSPTHLGGFYSRPADDWFPLDAAAKVYPLSMSHKQMAVFRLSMYLTEEVAPELLQMALTFTIKRFPFFATTIKNGFFWHYIDAAKRRFPVEPESTVPCADINVSFTGSKSFRVLYYKNRVSCEFFHILTDGTGGTVFLKSLVAEYLRLRGTAVPAGRGVLDVDGLPDAGESADDFSRYVTGRKSSGFVDKPAVQMGGKLSAVKPCQVIHFDVSSDALRDAARARGASVTALLTAMIFICCKAAMDRQHGTVHIQVPVNMRSYFETRTLRNFSLYANIHLKVEDIRGLDEILPEVARQLTEGVRPEKMQEMMNGAVKLVRSVRLVPLFIKCPVARVVYGFLGDRAFTTTLSNLGVVDMPEEMAEKVKKMDFVLGTVALSRAAVSVVSANGTATVSVAKLTTDPSFEERMYTLLKELGLEVKVTGSDLYGF